jgi:hypothetical protein
VPLSDFEQIVIVSAGAFVTLLLAGWLIYWIVRERPVTDRPTISAPGGDPASAGGNGEEAPPAQPPTVD